MSQSQEYIQHIKAIRENGEQDQIKQIEEEINQTLEKKIEPGLVQFLHFLLDYLSGDDISQKIQDLEEPFKSIWKNV